jgi:hypothetical protein
MKRTIRGGGMEDRKQKEKVGGRTQKEKYGPRREGF